MIQRYCKGIFTRNYKKTIGVDFLEKHVTASGEDVRLMLWDTAGQEEFDAITKAYYRGGQACVIAFSTTDKASFDAVKKWKRKVEDECGHIPMVLVQNKIDLLHESQVDNYEIEKFARNTGLKLFRTSVKENLNVSKVFHYLAERHIESVSRWSDESEDSALQIGGHPVHPNRDVRKKNRKNKQLFWQRQQQQQQRVDEGKTIVLTNPFRRNRHNQSKGPGQPQHHPHGPHIFASTHAFSPVSHQHHQGGGGKPSCRVI
eukprot:maker-scaffold380_size190731-snap-gene-0.40 protein:Tk02450 transcript:maker-scaffold380_size190731-snap-gene-0.40-mRNA-1 annotation:"ras-related protein rab-23"